MDEIFHDPWAASAYLAAHGHQVSRQTLNKIRGQGNGPLFVYHGGRVRYPQAELDRWMLSRTSAVRTVTRPRAA
jgi:hypothetical protein